MIELRSDTFTLPTREMIAAMSAAPLGDDVYGEDPTVRALEELAADTLGKPAACLTPSGTMANLASIMAHAPRGAAALVGSESDIYLYEAGGASVCGGISYRPIVTQPDGRLAIDDLAAAFPDDPTDPQFALPAVICLENTHNRCGGIILSDDYLRAVRRFAIERGVAVHLDGARIFNAAIGSGAPVADIARHADSVQFCLSKGLGAPIGSIVAGDEDFIIRVRRVRKMLGGGMRQAGVIAAAGIVAIRSVARLAEDHDNARRLAVGLARVGSVTIEPDAVQTNIVMFRIDERRMSREQFIATLRTRGVSVAELGHGRIRLVTHAGVRAADIDEAVAVIGRVLADA
jgi:threonine aldolase